MGLTADVVAEQSTDGVYAMATQWFVKIGDKHAGPFTSKQLKELAKAGQIIPGSYICKGEDGEPSGQWVLASKAKNLFESQVGLPPERVQPKTSSPASERSQRKNKAQTSTGPPPSLTSPPNETHHTINKSARNILFGTLLGMVCCWPLALWFIWNKEQWRVRTKWIVSIVLVLVVNGGGVIFVHMDEANRPRSDITDSIPAAQSTPTDPLDGYGIEEAKTELRKRGIEADESAARAVRDLQIIIDSQK